MTYKINFAIGDWSGDGHGRNNYTLVESNQSVEVVREAFFDAQEVTGINWEHDSGLCNEYGESALSKDMVKKFSKLGYTFNQANTEKDGTVFMGHDDMLDLLLWFLKLGNNSLKLQLANVPLVPTFHFYGYDKKKRHIPFIGYGLFD
jgi:hypothetical protein